MLFNSCELNILVLNESEVGGDLIWGGNLTLKLANYALLHSNGTVLVIAHLVSAKRLGSLACNG